MDKSYIIKKEKFKSVDWGGGITTQLFISPENSTLAKLDFDLRISTASIEVETSTFSSLPGVHRKLLLLDGNLKLEHKGHHTTNIPLYEIDQFEGGWETISHGKAIDFNIMTTKKSRTWVNVLEMYNDSSLRDRNLSDFTFILLYKGSLKTNYGNMSEGDLLVIGKKELYEIFTTENSIIVHCSISFLD